MKEVRVCEKGFFKVKQTRKNCNTFLEKVNFGIQYGTFVESNCFELHLKTGRKNEPFLQHFSEK